MSDILQYCEGREARSFKPGQTLITEGGQEGRLFVLIDGRHGLKEVDREMLKRLDQAALSYQIVLTKRDEVKQAQVDKTIEDAKAVLRTHPAAHPDVIFLSSHKGEGLAELRASVARLLFERDRTIFQPAQIG